MPPRKALTKVDANAPRPARQAGKKGVAIQQEDDALKAEVARLTAQLEQAKLETTPAVPAPVVERKNPFGGSFPTASYPSIAVTMPKRAITAFQTFSKEKRPEMKEQFPGADVHAINAKLGEMWKAASEEELKPYHSLVEDDRERFTREMQFFNGQKEKMETERLAVEYYTQELKMNKAMEFYEAHLASKKTTTKSGPEAPKQPRSAYNFFCSLHHKPVGEGVTKIAEDWSKVQKVSNKKNKLLLKQLQKMVADDEDRHVTEKAEYQQKLSDIAKTEANEKEEFKNAALLAYSEKTQMEADAKAYRKLMAGQKEEEKLERKKVREVKKAAKALKADEPRRPRNAYTLYFSDNAKTVSDYIRENKVEHSMAKEIADRWKNVGAREKKKYEKAAEKDRGRYDEEMKEYKAKKDVMQD